jgi:hypothetical protein
MDDNGLTPQQRAELDEVLRLRLTATLAEAAAHGMLTRNTVRHVVALATGERRAGRHPRADQWRLELVRTLIAEGTSRTEAVRQASEDLTDELERAACRHWLRRLVPAVVAAPANIPAIDADERLHPSSESDTSAVMALKTKPPASTGKARQALSELNADIVKYRERERELLAEQIQLEKAGVEAVDPQDGASLGNRVLDRAKVLINGYSDAAPIAVDQGARLFTIRLERDAIGEALRAMSQAAIRFGGAALNEFLENGGLERWREIQRGRAAALVAVAEFEAKAEAFRVECRALGAMPTLPGDRQRDPLARDARTLLEAIAAEGFIAQATAEPGLAHWRR